MTLKTIIKKLSTEPERFDKVKIKVAHSDGGENTIFAECSDCPFTIWAAYNDGALAPVSVYTFIRSLKTIENDKNQKAEILQWRELSDEEACW